MNRKNCTLSFYPIFHFLHIPLVGLLLLPVEFSKSFYWYIFLYSMFVFVLSLIHRTNNIVFLMRTLFLGSIGYMAFLTKLLNDNLLFGVYIQESQTFDIALLMYFCTVVALTGSEIGLSLGEKIKKDRFKNAARSDINKLNIFFWAAFILVLIAGYIYTVSLGPTIFEAVYSAANWKDVGLQNWNVIGNVSVFLMVLVYGWRRKNILFYWLLIFASLYLFGYVEILHGARMDMLCGLLGIYVVWSLVNSREPSLSIKQAVIIIVLFIFMQTVGFFRNAFIMGNFNVVTLLDYLWRTFSFVSSATKVAFYQGTINDMAITFSGIIYFIKHDIVNFIFGKSYFDFILRIPPSFIYPNRPQDLSWIFPTRGFTTGGGFFELAEAYYNFGIIGTFLVPLTISFIISRCYYNTLYRQSLWDYFVFFGILSMSIRGFWYQTFVFWKGFLTALIIYIALELIASILLGAVKNNRSSIIFKRMAV